MRFIVHLVLMLGLALCIGFGLSYYALTDGAIMTGYHNGPWTTFPRAGAPNPDPYSLAYITRKRELQLGLSEGISFIADTDSDGEALHTSCTYRIDGKMPLASFWTLAAEDRDGRNIARFADNPILDSRAVNRLQDGSLLLHVGSQLSPGNWLETRNDGNFRLQLRLYDAAAFSGSEDSIGILPSISKEVCA